MEENTNITAVLSIHSLIHFAHDEDNGHGVGCVFLSEGTGWPSLMG